MIAANTTLERNLALNSNKVKRIGAGGLSGLPLRLKATEIIRKVVERTNDKLPVIGVGGICHPDHAIEKLDTGAKLIQVYSGLIYYGPKLIFDINKRLQQRRNNI